MTLFPLLAILAALSVNPTFTPWFTDRGVAVEIARTPAAPWLRGTTVLAVGADKVGAAIGDFAHYKELFAPAIKSAAVVERGPDAARLHLVWPYPSPWRNRDAVVAYRLERRADGGFTLSWKGENRPSDPHEGVRIGHVEGETKVDPIDAGHSRVTYTYFGDLGGNFPGSIEERVWRGEPVGYIQALRRAVGLPVVKATK